MKFWLYSTAIWTVLVLSLRSQVKDILVRQKWYLCTLLTIWETPIWGVNVKVFYLPIYSVVLRSLSLSFLEFYTYWLYVHTQQLTHPTQPESNTNTVHYIAIQLMVRLVSFMFDPDFNRDKWNIEVFVMELSVI